MVSPLLLSHRLLLPERALRRLSAHDSHGHHGLFPPVLVSSRPGSEVVRCSGSDSEGQPEFVRGSDNGECGLSLLVLLDHVHKATLVRHAPG